MADDVLNVIVKLGGDWDKIQNFKNRPFEVKVNLKASFDKGLENFLAYSEGKRGGNKTFSVNLNVATKDAASALGKIKEQLKELKTLSNITIKANTPDQLYEKTAREEQRRFLRGQGVNTVGLRNDELPQRYLSAKVQSSIGQQQLQNANKSTPGSKYVPINQGQGTIDKIRALANKDAEREAIQNLNSNKSAIKLQRSLNAQVEKDAVQALNSQKAAEELRKANARQLASDAAQAFKSNKSALTLQRLNADQAKKDAKVISDEAIKALDSHKASQRLETLNAQQLKKDAEDSYKSNQAAKTLEKLNNRQSATEAVQNFKSNKAAQTLQRLNEEQVKKDNKQLSDQAVQALNSNKSAKKLETLNAQQAQKDAEAALKSNEAAEKLRKSNNQQLASEAVQGFKSKQSADKLISLNNKQLKDEAIQALNSHKAQQNLEEANIKQYADDAIAQKQSHDQAQKLQTLNNRQAGANAVLAKQSNDAVYKLKNLNFREESIQEDLKRELLNSSPLEEEAQVKRRLAFSRGILPEQVKASRGGLFSGERIKALSEDEQVRRELGFAALFGQGPGGKFAGVAGGIAGTLAGGTGGTFLGVAGGQIAFDLGKEAFNAVTESLRHASEAAFAFEKAIAGTTGALQATTDIYRGGEKVSPLDQLHEQQRRATGLQRAARAALFPLGIAGESEAAFVNAYVQGRLAKGQVASQKELQTVLPRLAATIKTIAPGLGESRQARELQDILTGQRVGNITAGPTIRALTPDLFKATTYEEIEKATRPLEAYVQALKAGNTPLAERIKLEGQLQVIQSDVGESFNQSLLPGLKKLNQALADEQITTTLSRISGGIGSFVSGLIDIGVSLSKNPIVAAITAIGIGAPLGATGAAVGLGGIGAYLLGGKKPTEEESKLQAKFNAQTQLAQVLGVYGLTNETFGKYTPEKADIIGKNPFAQSAAADTLLSKFPQVGPPAIDFDAQTALEKREAALNLQAEGLKGIQESNAKTYDTFLFSQDQAKQQYLQTSGLGIVNNNNARYQNLASQLSFETPGSDKYQLIFVQLQSAFNDLKTSINEVNNAYRAQVESIVASDQAQRSLRDSQEHVGDVQKDSELSYKELNRSLEEARQKLEEFPEALRAAITGKEQGILGAAQRVKQLGGELPLELEGIVSDPERLKAYQLKDAYAQLDQQRISVGDRPTITQPGTAGTFDLFNKTGGSFQLGLKNQEDALKDSITKTVNELDRLPRALRDAIEKLADLQRTLQTRFGDNYVPKTGNQPIVSPIPTKPEIPGLPTSPDAINKKLTKDFVGPPNPEIFGPPAPAPLTVNSLQEFLNNSVKGLQEFNDALQGAIKRVNDFLHFLHLDGGGTQNNPPGNNGGSGSAGGSAGGASGGAGGGTPSTLYGPPNPPPPPPPGSFQNGIDNLIKQGGALNNPANPISVPSPGLPTNIPITGPIKITDPGFSPGDKDYTSIKHPFKGAGKKADTANFEHQVRDIYDLDFPQPIKDAIKKAGINLKTVNKFSDEKGLTKSSDLYSGIYASKDPDTALGLYDGNVNIAKLFKYLGKNTYNDASKNPDQLADTVLHEYGHGIDAKLLGHISDSPEFKKLYNADKKNFESFKPLSLKEHLNKKGRLIPFTKSLDDQIEISQNDIKNIDHQLQKIDLGYFLQNAPGAPGETFAQGVAATFNPIPTGEDKSFEQVFKLTLPFIKKKLEGKFGKNPHYSDDLLGGSQGRVAIAPGEDTLFPESNIPSLATIHGEIPNINFDEGGLIPSGGRPKDNSPISRSLDDQVASMLRNTKRIYAFNNLSPNVQDILRGSDKDKEGNYTGPVKDYYLNLAKGATDHIDSNGIEHTHNDELDRVLANPGGYLDPLKAKYKQNLFNKNTIGNSIPNVSPGVPSLQPPQISLFDQVQSTIAQQSAGSNTYRSQSDPGFVYQGESAIPGGAAGGSTELIAAVKDLPQRIGLAMRQALDNSFSGS